MNHVAFCLFGNGNHDIAGVNHGVHLPGKHLSKIVIVTDSGEGRSIGGERQRRQAFPVVVGKSAQQLGRQMLSVGRTAAEGRASVGSAAVDSKGRWFSVFAVFIALYSPGYKAAAVVAGLAPTRPAAGVACRWRM